MSGTTLCRNCKNPLAEDARFCGLCGTLIDPNATLPTTTGASIVLDSIVPTIPAPDSSAHSLILDISLQPENLEPDFSNLTNNRWYRRDLKELRVHIDNHGFCAKVIEIASKSIQDMKADERIPGAMPEGIERRSVEFPISLPLFWANLSDLLAVLLREVFAPPRNILDYVTIALKSIKYTWEHAHYELVRYLHPAIYPGYAEKFGFPEIETYIQKYYKYYFNYGHERAIAKIYAEKDYEEGKIPDCLIYTTFVGSKSRKVSNQLIYLPKILRIDQEGLSFRDFDAKLVGEYNWYIYCIPQILVNFLCWATIHHGATIQEMDYMPGLKLDDYDVIYHKASPLDF